MEGRFRSYGGDSFGLMCDLSALGHVVRQVLLRPAPPLGGAPVLHLAIAVIATARGEWQYLRKGALHFMCGAIDSDHGQGSILGQFGGV
jgi:hypothetical protein